MTKLNPPVAPTHAHEVPSPHGARQDPYYWMRDDDRSNPEVLAHLKSENAYQTLHQAPLKPLEDRLFAEIVGRLKPDDATVPYLKNGWWYNSRFEAGAEHPRFVRRETTLDAPEQVMLDVNALQAGHDYYQVAALEVSPDSRWLAFCEDTVGRREYRLRFKDLRSGELLAETIPQVEPDLAWANDNRSILYVEKDPETLLGRKVKRHVLGTDPVGDELIFEQDDATLYTGVSKSKSDRYLFIHMHGTVTSEWRYADADDPALTFRVLLPRRRDHEYEIEHLGENFVIRTNWQAPNFRLMTVPIGREASQHEWQELVAESADGVLEDFEVFRSHLALSVRSGAVRRLGIKPLTGDLAPYFIDSEEPAYTTALSANPEIDSRWVRYVHSSLATPATVYDFHMDTRQKVLRKREPVQGGFDPTRYATERVFAPARDGARIPVSLVHRRDVARDGTAPLLLYAYGSYGLSMEPGFASARFSLIDRGFVYAIAHVRGGQEMGRAWYDAGRLLHKRNSFTDFIDVTHFLVAQGFAARDLVFAMGGSAGGLLVGAVANMSPGDYRGIVAQVPFVDVVTTMLDDSIPLTTNEYDEWGDPRDLEAYRYMLSYSPYDNVRAQAYPPLLVTTGLWDSQVQYYEPAKWVAKLRALKTDDNPVLLHVDLESGHGGKSGRFQHHRETAMEYAFILGCLPPRKPGTSP